MNKIIQKIMTFGFCLTLGFLLVAQAVPDTHFSELENRILSKMPDFTVAALKGGVFSGKMESYLQDQLPMRTFWVKLYGQTEKLLGRKELGGAYFGKGGGYFEVRPETDNAQFDKNISSLESIAEKFGGAVWFLGIPSAATVDSDRLPSHAYVPDEAAVFEKITAQLKNITSGYAKTLPSHYFSTDHHWTQEGSYQGYAAICAMMGFEPVPLEEYTRYEAKGFFGSLYSRAPYFGVAPDVLAYYIHGGQPSPAVEYRDTGDVKNSFFESQNLLEKDMYTAFLGGINAEIVIKTGYETGRKLVICKDSFSQPMISFLAPHFDEIAVLDLRYYKNSPADYAEEFGATDILFAYNLSWFANDVNIRSF